MCAGTKMKDTGQSPIDLSGYAALPFALSISDPSQEDDPLIYVSPAFERLTGYTANMAVGRNCRFLQGDDTDRRTVDEIREKLGLGQEVSVDIYNYRADGSGFWNRLLIGTIDQGAGSYRVSIAHEVTEREHLREESDKILGEIQHRVKNHLAMVVSMIRLQAREGEGRETDFSTLARRVEALQLLYQELSDAGIARHNDDIVPLGAYISRVAAAVTYASGREAIRLNLDTEQIDATSQVAGQLGLITSEILTNALQHAFKQQERGVVDVMLRQLANDIVRLRVSDDGCGLPADIDWPNENGLGSRIVRGLTRDLKAKLSVDRGATGTTVTLDIPMG